MTIATGTARMSPPNEDSPPCQMAMIWARVGRVVDEVARARCMARAPTMAATMTHTNMPVTHCHG